MRCCARDDAEAAFRRWARDEVEDGGGHGQVVEGMRAGRGDDRLKPESTGRWIAGGAQPNGGRD